MTTTAMTMLRIFVLYCKVMVDDQMNKRNLKRNDVIKTRAINIKHNIMIM